METDRVSPGPSRRPILDQVTSLTRLECAQAKSGKFVIPVNASRSGVSMASTNRLVRFANSHSPDRANASAEALRKQLEPNCSEEWDTDDGG